jgi:hypothetical protein
LFLFSFLVFIEASYDPIFWPTHGTLERLLSFKRASISLKLAKSVFNEDWGFSTENQEYLMGVCDWSGVQAGDDDLTLPTCNMSTCKNLYYIAAA